MFFNDSISNFEVRIVKLQTVIGQKKTSASWNFYCSRLNVDMPDNPISEDVFLKKFSVTQKHFDSPKRPPIRNASCWFALFYCHFKRLVALLQRYDKELELGTQAAIRDWINSTLKGEAGFTELVSNLPPAFLYKRKNTYT